MFPIYIHLLYHSSTGGEERWEKIGRTQSVTLENRMDRRPVETSIIDAPNPSSLGSNSSTGTIPLTIGTVGVKSTTFDLNVSFNFTSLDYLSFSS